MKRVEEAYVTDAYHSLSIEGYRVTPELIERVRGGNWNPDANQQDREQRNAMAARGYWQAFQLVQKSIGKVRELSVRLSRIQFGLLVESEAGRYASGSRCFALVPSAADFPWRRR
jgi:hypothetical protein